MSESFVDLSYRGLALARRIKLTQVRPSSGYLEMPTPMPVGTTLGIATDDGVLLEAVVTEIHEQIGGADRIPGMLVRPNLTVEAQDAWWRSKIALPEVKAEAKEPPPADADGKVTLVSPRMSGQGAVPELMDDGRDTGVMDAVDMEMADAAASGSRATTEVDTEVADLPPDTGPRTPRDTLAIPMGQPVAEEGAPRTTAMDAVDLAALGLDSSSDSLPVAKAEDYADAPPDKTDGAKPKKKRSKRR